jgi:hypothetical protein
VQRKNRIWVCAQERGKGIALVVGNWNMQVGGKQMSMAKMPTSLVPDAMSPTAAAATPEASRQPKQTNAHNQGSWLID